MGQLPLSALALAALAIALALVALGAWLASWWAGLTQRARNRVALEGEADAEAILEAEGYTVLARQVPSSWTFTVDGEPVSAHVRADLVVERDGQRYVAEVKTGERAPDPGHPPTRRQLLEYSLVFDSAHVLLVDVEARAVRVVAFPMTPGRPRPAAPRPSRRRRASN